MDDDTGTEHKFLIPNSYYVPSVKIRLLSSQHWDQSQWNQHGRESTGADDIILSWKVDKQDFKKGFPASSWEYHSIKKYTLYTYPVLER